MVLDCVQKFDSRLELKVTIFDLYHKHENLKFRIAHYQKSNQIKETKIEFYARKSSHPIT